MTTSKKHAEFDLEKKCLKETWHTCCNKVKALECEIVDAQNQLASTHNRNNENYGLIPVLNRKIRESNSRMDHYELAKNKLYFGKLVLTENNSNKSFYIGPRKLDLEELTIYSYNAPFASMYFSRENNYKLQNGKTKYVDLQLVRNLDVDHGDVLNDLKVILPDMELSTINQKSLHEINVDLIKKSQDMEWAPSMVEVESKERDAANTSQDYLRTLAIKTYLDDIDEDDYKGLVEIIQTMV